MSMTTSSLKAVGGSLALVMLAACASTTAPAPTTIRSSALTAPADLQLLCASEAATRFGASAENVLPTASRPGPAPGTYEVDVRLPAGQARCIINETGVVVSLERA